MPAPLARVVVVSWNGRSLLPACLASLRAQTVRDRLRVVVVDNASTDGTAEMLRTEHPDVEVVVAPENLGFAGGAELGTRDLAPGEHVVLLNNDATFAPDAVERMLLALDAAPRTGAVTARILVADPAHPERDAGVVNSTGAVVTRDGRGLDRDWLRPVGTESHDPDVFGFCGGAALLRQEALAEVGSFDPSLFLYYEDTDLSWRLRAHGWSVRYAADAVAVHRHAATTQAGSPLFRYYNTRNSLLVLGRHAPWRVVLLSWARQSAGLARAVLRGGLSPDVRARARALRDALIAVPRTCACRRALWREATVPRSVVARWIGVDAAGTGAPGSR